jgi:AbrB family looped-hinge helix DNA binding protein
MEAPMPVVKVSPKYQIVIPREVRESLDIKPGEKMEVFRYGDRIELFPVRKMRDLRGFLRGIDTTIDRDDDRA